MLEQFNFLSELLKLAIPEGTDRVIEVDNQKVSVSNKDGIIRIKTVDEFDDSEVKNVVSKFKELVAQVDDDVFVEVCDELDNTQRLDELCDKESFTKEEGKEVYDLISAYADKFKESLTAKINELIELRDQF